MWCHLLVYAFTSICPQKACRNLYFGNICLWIGIELLKVLSPSWMPGENFFAQWYLILALICDQDHNLQDSVLSSVEELPPINNKIRDPSESAASISEANRAFLLISLSPDLRTDVTECCLVTYSTALPCKLEEKVWKYNPLNAFYQEVFCN